MLARSSPWYFVLSSYWFASSYKWFALLLVLLPARVAELVPEPERVARLGLLFAIGAGMALVGPAVFGYISDRVGRRMPFIGIGTLLTVLALAWLAYAPNFAQLLLAYIVLQLADDMATGPYSALIPDLVARREHGLASGWLGTFQLLGSVAAGLTGFWLIGLTLQFLLVALVVAVSALLIITQIREVPGLRGERWGFLESLLAPWQSADFRWVWLTRFLVMLGQYSAQTYLQFYLADVVRTFNLFGRSLTTLPAQAVAFMGLLIAVGAALSAIPAGQYSDTQGRKRVIYVAGVGLAAVMLLMLLLPRYDALLVLALAFGVFYGAYLAVDWALISDVLPDPSAHATGMGLWQTSIVLPQMLAGSLGALVGRLNAEGGGGYTLLFLLSALCFVLGAGLVSRVRRAK
jgi:MFS family permease